MIDRLIEFIRAIKYAHHFVVIKLGRFIHRKTYKSVCLVKCILAKSHFAIRSNSEKTIVAKITGVARATVIKLCLATPLFDRSFYCYYSIMIDGGVKVCYKCCASTRNGARLSIPPIDDDSPFSSLDWKVYTAFKCTQFNNERCRNASIIRLFVSCIARVNTLPAYA